MAYIRQSRPDSGLGFQAQVLQNFQFVPSLLGSGLTCWVRGSSTFTTVNLRADLPGDLVIGHGLAEVALAHAHVEDHQRALPDRRAPRAVVVRLQVMGIRFTTGLAFSLYNRL